MSIFVLFDTYIVIFLIIYRYRKHEIMTLILIMFLNQHHPGMVVKYTHFSMIKMWKVRSISCTFCWLFFFSY